MNQEPNNTAVTAAHQLVAEINALHQDVMRGCETTEGQVHAALVAAWRAGGLLNAAKKEVRARMGHGAWREWLTKHFAASERTAQNYMRLAKSATTVADLGGLSLRQSYQRLGMRVEKHGVTESVGVPAQVGPGRIIRRLLARLPAPTEVFAMKRPERERLLSDLAPLHRRLNEIFDAS